MFTGLVEAVGTIRSLEHRGEAARLTLETALAEEFSPGESLAVNGCCLTVTDKEEGVSFDLLVETLHRTNLGNLRPGSRVNLERALRAASGGVLWSGPDGECARFSARSAQPQGAAARPGAACATAPAGARRHGRGEGVDAGCGR